MLFSCVRCWRDAEDLEGSCRFSLLLLGAAAGKSTAVAQTGKIYPPPSPTSLYLLSLWLSATLL
jgi:hypothetical protein